MNNSNSKGIFWAAGLLVGAIVIIGASYSQMFGHNEAGQRHFVQTFFGNQKTVTAGGPFWYGNGTKEPYMNALRTIRTPVGRACDYEQNDGFIVQYGDGGKGSICAQLDSVLPTGKKFGELHAKYRSEQGVRNKLLDPNYRALFTTTAELFTSTEAYQTKRSQISAALQEQLRFGPYVTTTEDREIVVGINKDGTAATQTKSFSVVKYSDYDKDGKPSKGATKLHQANPFTEWEMSDIQVKVTGYDFEPKTMTQIADRRDATNRGQTAQANAKAAYWEGEKEKATGETKRIKAQALAEIKNAPAIADAKREAELAVINAKKLAEQSKELKIAADNRFLEQQSAAKAAKEEAKVIVTLANANAYKLDKMQQAGVLFKRIDADVIIQRDRSSAMAQMKVPANMTIMGGSEGTAGTEGAVLQLMMVEKLNQLNAK